MDFWDVAKLMWRRWYVTVPALLLTAAAGIWVAANVEPDYRVTGHIAVVGPAVQRTEADSTVTRVNPWSGEALADAAAIRLQGEALAGELAAEGLTGEWAALVTGRLPVIRLEVVAQQPEQAQATLQRIREVIEQEVRGRQSEYNIPPEEQFSTVDYDGGETVEPVTGKVKRALIVVVGAGLILTVGLVVAFDALVRRRRAHTQPPPPSGSSAAAVPPPEQPQPRYQYAAAAAGAASVPVAGQPSNGSHRPVGQPTRAAQPVQVRYADQPNSDHGYPDPGYADPGYAEHLDPGYDRSHQWPVSPAQAPDDSTVVLPLSNVRSRDSSGGREPSTEVRMP